MFEWVETVKDFASLLDLMQSPALCGDWTCEDDRKLVVGVLRGNGFAGAVAETGRSEIACRGRWDAIYPPELRSIKRQEVLRRLVEDRAVRALEKAAQRADGTGAGA
ncbi:hypothetical protein [Pararhodobacter zhoushanensis]|uniref:hypothetical protein n=1 Tax=Pararhodobacter zhoushanensis TaxID=2479545 RepID=UPI000F8D237E|nr:hypothetical protein [Pararhodobacter zhoushanensis]